LEGKGTGRNIKKAGKKKISQTQLCEKGALDGSRGIQKGGRGGQRKKKGKKYLIGNEGAKGSLQIVRRKLKKESTDLRNYEQNAEKGKRRIQREGKGAIKRETIAKRENTKELSIQVLGATQKVTQERKTRM